MPPGTGYFDYGYNYYGLGNPDEPLGIGTLMGSEGIGRKGWEPVPETGVISPSETVALGDGVKGGNSVIQDGVTALWRVGQGEKFLGSTKRSQSRHRGNANIYFCDGHASAVSLNRLFTDTSDQALRIWNRDNLPHRSMLPK